MNDYPLFDLQIYVYTTNFCFIWGRSFIDRQLLFLFEGEDLLFEEIGFFLKVEGYFLQESFGEFYVGVDRVVSGVVGYDEGVAAGAGLSFFANFVGGHSAVVPDFIALVEEALGWGGEVGHDIGVVHNSVDDMNGMVPSSKLFVSNSWLSIGVDTVESCPVNWFKFGCCKGGQGSSEAVTGDVNRGISVDGSEILDVFEEGAFGEVPGWVEAVVDFAATALGVGDLVEGEVADPVGNVAGASEGDDDSIQGWGEAGEPLEVSSLVIIGLDVDHGVFFAVRALPGIDGFDWLVGDSWHVGQFFGYFLVVGGVGQN